MELPVVWTEEPNTAQWKIEDSMSGCLFLVPDRKTSPRVPTSNHMQTNRGLEVTLGLVFPQALHWFLSSFLLKRREKEERIEIWHLRVTAAWTSSPNL
jgi:hypothetical protein